MAGSPACPHYHRGLTGRRTKGLIDALRQQVNDLQQDRLDDKASRDADKREHQDELAKRDARLDAFEEKLRAVSSHNHALTNFIYVMLAILRRHGLIGEINPQDVPDGIRI
jgi:glutathionyl-hydroquinone reductase